MSVNYKEFGKNKDNNNIVLITLTNENGYAMGVTNLGASLVSFCAKDKSGSFRDVVLGFKSGEYYEHYNFDAMGSTVGRNANRISNHSFELNGIRYELADTYQGANIHSGPDLYGKRLWDYEVKEDDNGSYVKFSLLSPDMDQGIPGNLEISVTYMLTADNSMRIIYEGVSDKDTRVNMTNHGYYNLNGHGCGNIDNHLLYINADSFTYSEDGNVANDTVRDVTGTPFDFRNMKKIKECLESDFEPVVSKHGLDHNFCLNNNSHHAVRLESEESGIALDVYTDRPGIQIYTANHMNMTNGGKDNKVYGNRGGIALETQFYPDAVNHKDFLSPVVKAGMHFRSVTEYKFSVIGEK